MPRQSRQVAGADHRQHAFRTRRHLAQARGHVAVALGDHALVQRRAALRELAEGGLQDVAFLELLDLVLFHFLAAEQPGRQAGGQLHLAEEAEVAGGAAEGQADFAVDQLQAQAALLGDRGSTLEFGAGLDAKLLGQSALVSGQGEVGGEHCHAALADHLDQVELCQRIGIGKGLQPGLVELHCHGVEDAAVDGVFHRLDAGVGDMRGAKQGVVHAVALDDGMRLALPQGGLGFGHRLVGFFVDAQSM